eukprot:bmy_12567T0
MFLNRDTDPSKDDMAAEPRTCSLPELYAFVEHFNKENKKSNLLKTHCISPSEAQKILSQNLNGTGGTDGRGEDSQPVFTCKVVRKEERPESMTELLHRSLLTRSLSPVERLSKSQKRISQYGIPPPLHTFPYEILMDHSKSMSLVAIRKRIQSTEILCRLGIPTISPEKFIFEDKVPKYLLVDPGAERKSTSHVLKGKAHPLYSFRFLQKHRIRILSLVFEMMGLGNGRRSMKSPPLVLAALVACIIVLGFNYWIASSRSVDLQTRIVELEGRVRRAAAERGAVEMKKNEFQGELEKQREQLDKIQSSHNFQMESVNKLHQDEKARPAWFSSEFCAKYHLYPVEFSSVGG